MIRRAVLVLAPAAAAAGCKTTESSTARATPPLSPVGSGLSTETVALPAAFTAPTKRSFHGLWGGNNQGLFGDLRAHKVGDLVTVMIDINDQAQFDNESGRSREAGVKATAGGGVEFGGFGADVKAGEFAGNLTFAGKSSMKGTGSIGRSETLRLRIAAVVSEVLPNGNLVISGSQEARVNKEVRVLTIAGIVRPIDISSSNTIFYEKIAEARISYGGRGKLSDVQ